jgi:nicotinate-nucleotide pyrophosphorylase
MIINQAANALDEDVGSGDISAELIDAKASRRKSLS